MDYKMKLHIKEQMCRLAFSETTIFTPPPKKVQTKGVKKE